MRCAAAVRRAPFLAELGWPIFMSEPRYLLKPHIYLCPTDFHWILLDVERDKYLCIHRRHFAQLAPFLYGSPQTIEQPCGELGDNWTEIESFASTLIEQGILTVDSTIGKTYKAVDLPAPNHTLNPARIHSNKVLRLIYAPSFAIAAGRADHLLRRRSFAHTVQTVEARKHKYRSGRTKFDLKRAEELVLLFNALRPLYPRDYLCLFDSLALIEFLAPFGLYPSWVFGVTADPFQAHCWVQEGHVVLNDTIERVSTYNAIMTV
jgi:hypothetical protein